jgi:hypothetical protein
MQHLDEQPLFVPEHPHDAGGWLTPAHQAISAVVVPTVISRIPASPRRESARGVSIYILVAEGLPGLSEGHER